MIVLLSAAACAASCTGAAAQSRPAAAPSAARTRLPGPAASVLAGPADALAAGAARALLVSAPVVVVASAASPAGLSAAAASAERAHAPLLLAASPAGTGAGSGAGGGTAANGPGRPQVPALGALTRAEIIALHPRAVLAAGIADAALSAQLPGIRVVTAPARLPATGAARPLHGVILLVHQSGPAAATVAAAATAQLAGVRLVSVRGYDPRADPAAITALSAARPRQVVALGAGFGPPGRLAARLAVAATGVQLPGGGQVLFPLHRHQKDHPMLSPAQTMARTPQPVMISYQ